MYYAESKGEMIDQCSNIHEYCDLHRFTTRKDRDEFVAEGGQAISAKDARASHKEQFRYWEDI